MDEALPWRARARRGEPAGADPAFALWDQDLKARGLNPGTSADLCVAVALTAALGQPSSLQHEAAGSRGPTAAAAPARFH
jgi:triphosphoribosyl-dephospho-CoA synthase